MNFQKSNKLKITLIILLILIFSIGYLIFDYYSKNNVDIVWEPINLTEENLPIHLTKLKLVQEIPKDGIISLKIGDEEYIIEKDSVIHGIVNKSDISIFLPRKYFEIIGKVGWCEAMKIARMNNEIEIILSDSPASIMWKYKALTKYKNCFG